MTNRIAPGDPALAARLQREMRGEVLFDGAARGRYSTDASIYQIEPVGVVVPHTEEDALVAMQIAMDAGVPVLPRGAGTSQCGQTVGAALVIDASKHLVEARSGMWRAERRCSRPAPPCLHRTFHVAWSRVQATERGRW